MHRDDYVGRQPLELGHGVIGIVMQCQPEMKPAEDRVSLPTPNTAVTALIVLIRPTCSHENMTTNPRPWTI
jgi:hypothetical protein